MTARLAVLLPLLLVGCTVGGNTPEAECRREAYNDPSVKEIYGNSNGNYTQAGTIQAQLKMAMRQATLKCLREKGLAPPGGVEPVQPRY